MVSGLSGRTEDPALGWRRLEVTGVARARDSSRGPAGEILEIDRVKTTRAET